MSKHADRTEMLARAEMRWMSVEDAEIEVTARALAELGRDWKAAEAEAARLRNALEGLLNDDELCRYPPDGDECACSSCKRIREARAVLDVFRREGGGMSERESSTAATPCGTCYRCGGTLYANLTHQCTTNVAPGQVWHTGETTASAHACNCVGCCPACGTCRTWHGHTPQYCALLVRQAAERFYFLSGGVPSDSR